MLLKMSILLNQSKRNYVLRCIIPVSPVCPVMAFDVLITLFLVDLVLPTLPSIEIFDILKLFICDKNLTAKQIK